MTGNQDQGIMLQVTRSEKRAMWVFRFAVVVLAYMTVALCVWLSDTSSSPLVLAIPVAVGLALGFVLVEWNRVKFLR